MFNHAWFHYKCHAHLENWETRNRYLPEFNVRIVEFIKVPW